MKKAVCESRKKYDVGLGNHQASVRGRMHEPYMEIPNSPKTNNRRQLKRKLESMFISFFNIKGIKKNRPGRPNSQFRILL
jgi:hypothetical protein